MNKAIIHKVNNSRTQIKVNNTIINLKNRERNKKGRLKNHQCKL